MAERGPYVINDAAMRGRALKLLNTFLLTSADLAFALGISQPHAGMLLRRLWEQGHLARWAYRNRSYRYGLKDALR